MSHRLAMPRQRRFLEGRGIPVPTETTEIGASRMIDFILRGNGTMGENEGQRIEVARSYSQRYVGRLLTIARENEIQTGTGIYLYAYTPEEVAKLRDTHGEGFILHPFRVRVKLKGGIRMFIDISELSPADTPAPSTPES
jgi:hypothetical protein